MPGIESRRSRKLRESVHINGIQTHVLKEISTPGSDGTIPLLNFLENTNNFVLRANELQLNERIYNLETKVNSQKNMLDELNSLLNNFEKTLKPNILSNDIKTDESVNTESDNESIKTILSRTLTLISTHQNIESIKIPFSNNITDAIFIEDTTPIIEETRPIIEDTTPIIEDTVSEIEETETIYEDASIYNPSIADDITVSDMTRTTYMNYSVYNSSPSSVHLEILRSIEEISKSTDRSADLLQIENENETKSALNIQFSYDKEALDKIKIDMEESIKNSITNELSILINEHNDIWISETNSVRDLLNGIIIEYENYAKTVNTSESTLFLSESQNKCIDYIKNAMNSTDLRLNESRIELLKKLHNIFLTTQDKAVELRRMLNESLATSAEYEYNTVAHINLEQIKNSLFKSIEHITIIINKFLFKINNIKEEAEKDIIDGIDTTVLKKRTEMSELIDEIRNRIRDSESKSQYNNSLQISDMATNLFKSEEIIKASETISINLIKSEYLFGQNIIQECKIDIYNTVKSVYDKINSLKNNTKKTKTLSTLNSSIEVIIKESLQKINDHFDKVLNFIMGIIRSEIQTANSIINDSTINIDNRSIPQQWGITTTTAVLKKWEDSAILNIENETKKIRDTLLATLNSFIDEIKQYSEVDIESIDTQMSNINKAIGDTVIIRNKMEQHYSEISKFIIQNLSIEKENIVKYLTDNISKVLGSISESIMKEDIAADESNINDYALGLLKSKLNNSGKITDLNEIIPDNIASYIEEKKQLYENKLESELVIKFDGISKIIIYNDTLNNIGEKSTELACVSVSNIENAISLALISKFNKYSTDLVITQYINDRNMIKMIRVIKLLLNDVSNFVSLILANTIMKYSEFITSGNIVEADNLMQNRKILSRTILTEYMEILSKILENDISELNKGICLDIDTINNNFTDTMNKISLIIENNKVSLDSIINIQKNADNQMKCNMQNARDGFNSKLGLINSIYHKMTLYNEQLYTAELFETMKLTLFKPMKI
jgi:hypothetical protein